MTKTVNKSESYSTSTGNTTVSVQILYGQLGTTLVQLDGRTLVWGSVYNLNVGDQESIHGKTLYIESRVKDVMSKSDDTGIAIRLDGKGHNETFEYLQRVEENGSSILYCVTINLI